MQAGFIVDCFCVDCVTHMQELDRGEQLVLEASASFLLQQSMYAASCTKKCCIVLLDVCAQHACVLCV